MLTSGAGVAGACASLQQASPLGRTQSAKRPVLKVTPNPRDLLAEHENSTEHNTWNSAGSLLKRAASASGEHQEVEYSSVPVYFSFPPPDDPFDPLEPHESLLVSPPCAAPSAGGAAAGARGGGGALDGADVVEVLDLGGGLW